MGYGCRVNWRTIAGRWSGYAKARRAVVQCHWRNEHSALAATIDRLRDDAAYLRIGLGVSHRRDMDRLKEQWKRRHPELATTIAELRKAIRPEMKRMANRLRKRKKSIASPGHGTARQRRWKRDNPDRVAEYESRRRDKTSSACPLVKAFYRDVFRAESVHCSICGLPVAKGERSVDHVIPLSRGGRHEIGNLAPAHMICNERKSNRLPHEFAA